MGEKLTRPHIIRLPLTSADKGRDEDNDYVRKRMVKALMKRMVKALMKRMVNEDQMARRVMMVNG